MATFLIVLGFALIVGGLGYIYRAWLFEKIKGYRTIIWNALVAMCPVLLTGLDKLQALDLTQYLTPTNAIIAGVVIGGMGIWLRTITTGPVGSKGEDDPSPETKSGD